MAIKPHNSNKATTELIMAFALAKICGSNPRLTLSVTRPNTETATKIITEKSTMRIVAFLSFFFQVGGNIVNVQQIFFCKEIKTVLQPGRRSALKPLSL